MTVTALASVTDVEAVFGRVLTSDEDVKVVAVLAKASEVFRRRSGQQFTTGASVVRLKVNGGRVYLTQSPVTAITTVLDDNGNPVPYAQTGQWLDVDLPSDRFVTVDYSHGGTVPDLVRLTIAEVAKRSLSIHDDAAQGMVQVSETAGPFTESRTYAGWAQGAQTLLSPDDIALAESYRTVVPHVIVMVGS